MQADPTSEAVTFHDQDATCSVCAEVFVWAKGFVGDEPMPIRGPKLCPECLQDDEPKAAQQEQEPNRDERILVLLDEAGVNVRKHGRCLLVDGTRRGIEFDTSECGPTPLETAHVFVEEALTCGRWGYVQGISFMGSLGNGKTHLAVGIIRALLLDERIDPGRVIFDRADRLITIIQDTYGTGQTGKLLDRRERAHLLVIDDIGREKATPDTLRIIVDLINAREGHPTVTTSNYTPAGLASRWAGSEGWQRLASRLGPQNFRQVEVTGHDRRAVA
jgi:hypothetical protein